jgi:hypothetical protein
MPILRKHTFGSIDFFYTMESIEDKNDATVFSFRKSKGYMDSLAKMSIENIFENLDPKMKKLIDLNAKRNNLSGKAVLQAHGDSEDNGWYFRNGSRRFLVQNWINKMDGKYSLIVLICCNPSAEEICSRKSSVLVPDEIFSHIMHLEGQVNMELYVPEVGYADSYTLDYEISRMRRLLGNKQKIFK